MDFNVEVKDGKTVRLPTAEKYCDYDIVVTATSGDSDLAKQIVERTVVSITDSSITKIGDYAFANCKELTDVNFPAVEGESIGSSAFSGDTSLVTADFPKLGKTGFYMFQNCSSLKNVNMPEVTDLRSNTFNGCSALEKIDLPKCKAINGNVFFNCANLIAVILRSDTVATLSNINSFDGTPIADGTGYFYVHDSVIDSYKTATNFSTFAQFRAIEDYPEICGEVST